MSDVNSVNKIAKSFTNRGKNWHEKLPKLPMEKTQ